MAIVKRTVFHSGNEKIGDPLRFLDWALVTTNTGVSAYEPRTGLNVRTALNTAVPEFDHTDEISRIDDFQPYSLDVGFSENTIGGRMMPRVGR